MSWKERFNTKFRHKMRNMPDTEKHLINFIEELLEDKDKEIKRLEEELQGYIEEEAGASL